MNRPVDKRWAWVLIGVGIVLTAVVAFGIASIVTAEHDMNRKAAAREALWSGKGAE